MNELLTQNFDNLTFDEWLDFVFDEKWTDSKTEYNELSDFDADVEIFVENCIKLFENPSFLLKKYSAEQLESGFFYFILSPRANLNWWLWSKQSSIDLRRRFISSTVNVFEKLFTKNALEHSCFMWWDSLRDFDDDKDLKVMDWMFAALSKILGIDSIDCQLSALHGLGHIEHHGKKDLIKTFLRRHPKFADKEYALAAIEGKVL